MTTRTIDIKTKSGHCDTFIAYPNDTGSFPAVLFLMDAFGPRPALCEMAEKLASYGYYVLLPNLFYRVRRAPVVDVKFPIKKENLAEVFEIVKPLAQTYDPELAISDVESFIDYLSGQAQVRKGKMGITGYCMGGRMAVRAAAHFPDRIAAAASFHAGNLATDAANSPHHDLKRVQGELYIASADHDPSMPPEQIKRLENALIQAKVRYKTELYSGAFHGFTMTDLPACNPAALERHWQNLVELFARCL